MLRIYRELLELLDHRERRRFWILCGLIFLMGLLEIAGVVSILPFIAIVSNPQIIETNEILSYVYDALNFQDSNSFLIFAGVCAFILIVAGQLYKSFIVYSLNRFSRMREFSISSRLLAAYLNQPYHWFLTRNSTDLGKTILSEVDQVVNGVLVPALRLLAFSVIVVMLLLLLVILEPMVALCGALLVGGSYASIFVVARRYLNRIGERRLQANAQRFRAAQESFGGVKDVKLLGLEDVYLQRFRRAAAPLAHYRAMALSIGEIPRFLLEAIVFGALLVLVLTMLMISEGRLEDMLPMIGVFAFAGAKMFPAAQNVYLAMSRLRFSRAALASLRTDYVVRRRASSPTAANADDVRLQRRLEFADVRYAYPNTDRAALDGLTLSIEANTTVGFVGSSGAGKTTAIDVLLGLLTPQHGTIRVDGEPLGPGNLRGWQRRLGYVPQQIFLTDDSIAANIALGCAPEAIDMAAVERAARIAELHDFIRTELPYGYDTHVGERGVRLSGGQRQRIGIARALYHDPDVLILDEATSALDNLTEGAVMAAIDKLSHAKTIIMIAHRLSTVRRCDKIFMLEHGRCLAAGNYDSLFHQNADFRKLAAAV